jgi:hypothetical protein
MIRIDEDWLKKQGVKETNQPKLKSLVALALNELELRIGSKLAEKLTQAQIDEFENMDIDENKRIEWLEKAYPDYRKITRQEHRAMGEEIFEAQDKEVLIRGWSK